MSADAAPDRAHTIVLSASADTAAELAAQVRAAADAIAAGGFGVGRVGIGQMRDAGGVLSFSYTHDPAAAGSHTAGATPAA